MIKIKCFTWNVGNAMPNEAQLQEWLPSGEEASKYDLIAVGTQENSFKGHKAIAKILRAAIS